MEDSLEKKVIKMLKLCNDGKKIHLNVKKY